MQIKTIIDKERTPQKTRVEFKIEVGGGKTGEIAVETLVKIIDGLKRMPTEEAVAQHLYSLYGYAACCMHCGFLTEKSTDDLMHMAEYLAENEVKRIKAKIKSNETEVH